MMHKLAAGSIALSLGFFAANAMALVTEPNGQVVPVDSQNGEEQLYTLFQTLGEPIDWQAEGMATPNAFSPMCDFTATFVLHESACSQALAWYNETGQTPANSDLHIIIPAGSPLGQVFTGTDIKSDPSYAGGLVGFALVGDPSMCVENHHTNPSYNNMCSACSNPGPWITAVIYASKNTPNSYYVGFEDGATSASSWNNDGDFNDDVFFITGVTCAGGGQPCDTGKPGICAVGVTQCVTGGSTICKETNQPAGEKCDALDNNCDGTVDEGDICAAGLVCVKGKCVPKCGGGEFNCPVGKTCSAGYCIETACVQVNCQAGQICVAGKCVGACDGVVCPVPQACVAGVCVDACAGVTCPQGQVCEKGACVTGCGCAPCGAGLACNATTQHCTDPACSTSNCPAGQFCQAGSCIDACTGATCPTGQACQNGQCIEIPSDGGTAGSGGSPYDGSLFPDTGGGGKKDASAQEDGSSEGGPGGGTHNGGSATGDDGGCGCRAAGQTGSGSWLAIAAFAALALRGPRGRRRHHESKDSGGLSPRPRRGSLTATAFYW